MASHRERVRAERLVDGSLELASGIPRTATNNASCRVTGGSNNTNTPLLLDLGQA